MRAGRGPPAAKTTSIRLDSSQWPNTAEIHLAKLISTNGSVFEVVSLPRHGQRCPGGAAHPIVTPA